MMFDYREFLMQGFVDAVGKMADYQIILNSNGYYEKGVLTKDDLSKLQSLIESKNKNEIINGTFYGEETSTEEAVTDESDSDAETASDIEAETQQEVTT